MSIGTFCSSHCVAYLVEAGADVALQNPPWRRSLDEHDVSVLESIGTPAALAEAVGVRVGPSLGYGCQGQRVERLHGAVVQGGNAQGAKFAVFLRDIDAAQGLGSVSVTFEVICGLEFLSVRSPYDVIYTGRFERPGSWSLAAPPRTWRRGCESAATARLRPAVFALLNCLGNTHLQPSNLLLKGRPVDGLPLDWSVERRIG